MENEYLDDNIDRCLATISETLYNFQDEIVNMHKMVELITFSRGIQDRKTKPAD